MGKSKPAERGGLDIVLFVLSALFRLGRGKNSGFLYLMNSQGRLLGKNLGFLYPAFLSDGTGMRNSCHLRLFWATRGAD